MRISDWSSDVCSSDLGGFAQGDSAVADRLIVGADRYSAGPGRDIRIADRDGAVAGGSLSLSQRDGAITACGAAVALQAAIAAVAAAHRRVGDRGQRRGTHGGIQLDRKSTRLNSSH